MSDNELDNMIDSARENGMTPESFTNAMKTIHDYFGDYSRIGHEAMDDLMCSVLSNLGFGDGIDVFYSTDKFYS